MSIYTVRFAAVAFVGTGGGDVFTAPDDGFTYELRDVCMGCVAGDQWALILHDAGFSFQNYLAVLDNGTGALEGSLHVSLRQVISAGDSLLFGALSVGNEGNVTLTGYRLS